MKVKIITQRELINPHLKLDINLETGTISARLTYRCPECEGHGCHGKVCDDSVYLAPEDIIATLGPDAKPLLSDLLNGCLSDAR